MCGIAGFSLFVDSDSSSTPNVLANHERVLSHRGPDDSGSYEDHSSGIGLVHRRLSIFDTSSLGHQPMISICRQVVLIFNGEIYNFKSLRSELIQLGYSFVGNSDTEVLLNCYLQARDNDFNGIYSLSSVLRRLNGIFSFALWDSSLDSLIVARDAFGVKPFYYVNSDNGFHFSSEIKSFSSDHSLDYQSLDRYLSFLWSPGNSTISASVHKLGPGEVMYISKGLISQHFSWYKLPVFSINSPKSCSNYSNLVSSTQFFLRQAVERQVCADVPLGSFLSGGLDSSSIVAFAREFRSDIPCFTIALSGIEDEGFSDDLSYAKYVASHLDVPLDVISLDSSQMASCLEAMVYQLDEPLADPAALNVYFISAAARNAGIKVLLSGTGGDDLFSGYRRHFALQYEYLWSWLPRPLRIQLRQLTSLFPSSLSFCRRIRKAFSGAHLEGDMRLLYYFRWIDRSDLLSLYTPEFRRALCAVQAEDPMHSFLSDIPVHTSPLERMLALEQRFFLTDHNLIYTDKMSMAAGVEVRVPFLDLDLVDFAAHIPTKYKQRGSEGKWILKKAMEDYLPHKVIYRPKTGFGAPLRHWLNGDLRDWLADLLSKDRLLSRGLFDPDCVHSLIAANASGRVDASYTLLSLACIEIWCKFFIDKEPEPVLKL